MLEMGDGKGIKGIEMVHLHVQGFGGGGGRRCLRRKMNTIILLLVLISACMVEF